jgi:hypothetical protein
MEPAWRRRPAIRWIGNYGRQSSPRRDKKHMAITQPSWLIPAYIANILILVPVCYRLFFGGGMATVFEGKVPESEGLRLLVGSLWFAILVASITGLFRPAFFSPVVIIQIVYKSLWLLAFVLPLVIAGKPIPIGISVTFAAIVLTYPALLWLAVR